LRQPQLAFCVVSYHDHMPCVMQVMQQCKDIKQQFL